MSSIASPMNGVDNSTPANVVGVGGRSRNGKADRTRRSCGVGFNEMGDFKIDCDDEQWSQIVKADPHARHMRSKSWPH
ncbi:hypothetical protein AAHA92_14326 [Salvia divinorum]|uniref:Uncharacterized protein n=1 Tax=Salvia divinorum TaxID=28513 RepID=A0ABD1HB59_SALDI